jgi:hypothetical protein
VAECERDIVGQRWQWGVAEDVSGGRTGGGGAEGALLRGWLGVISLLWWCVAIQGLTREAYGESAFLRRKLDRLSHSSTPTRLL